METRSNTKNRAFKVNGKYRLVQRSTDGLWYVIGYCGDGYWMQMSKGYSNASDATVIMNQHIGSEAHQKECLGDI